LLLLLATILELLGRLIDSTGVTIASAAAVGAVISDALLTPGVTLGTIRRRIPSRMTVGVPVAVEVTIEARTRRLLGSRRPVVLIDSPAGLDSGRIVTPALRSGEHSVAQRMALPVRRGHWSEGGVIVVEAYSPLGGFVRRATQSFAGGWVVHPPSAPPLRLPEPAGGELLGSTSSQRSGTGTDFFGIREWRGGDPSSAIHWRASARRNQLVVMERERPGRPALVVLVGVAGEDNDWEQRVARAAATAVRALQSGRPVVLVADTDFVNPATPRDVLDWFAAVGPAADADVETIRTAMRGAGRGAAVLWLGSAAMPAALNDVMRMAASGPVVTCPGESGAAQ
jgi:uncharacterized protein (DUF58 family)